MKFVVGLGMLRPDFYAPMAAAAEAVGFDVVTVSDSIGYPRESSSTYPYLARSREFLETKPFVEPLIAMAALASSTSRIELFTRVLKLPVRHPVLLAKQLSSLAVLSANRVRLGVGTSPWPEDYELVGLPWAGRGRRFVECIHIVRGLLAGGYFEHHGEHYDIPAVKLNPVPTAPVPFVIGGNSAAMKQHAVELGDGWCPAALSAAELAAELPELLRRRDDLGRTGQFVVFGGMVATIDEVDRWAEAGATHVTIGYGPHFDPYGPAADTEGLEPKLDRLRRFGDEVIGPHRQGV